MQVDDIIQYCPYYYGNDQFGKIIKINSKTYRVAVLEQHITYIDICDKEMTLLPLTYTGKYSNVKFDRCSKFDPQEIICD